MSGSRYVVVNGARKKTVNCLKFWLAFFVIATAALAGVVTWLIIAAKNASDNELMTASGYPVPEICTLPATSGPCKANLKRFFFDSTTGACKDFIYGGCSGNGNNFETLDECMRTCNAKPSKFNLQAQDKSFIHRNIFHLSFY
ncbi:unnamed protein product [Rodentolepis nana]|uniref:BPTI/Kunitz inhibitor domain-containing protein n=1 Tax=Rodentolepis nana TaxID=102285 RepID=A0A0R3TZC0_RODNA|nr:unnamed protein product [Rodentolepis nana]